jgi:hypothetical protein
MNPLVQISEVSVKVCFVCRPRQSIHPGGGIAFEREERHPQAVDADVVEECSEASSPTTSSKPVRDHAIICKRRQSRFPLRKLLFSVVDFCGGCFSLVFRN